MQQPNPALKKIEFGPLCCQLITMALSSRERRQQNTGGERLLTQKNIITKRRPDYDHQHVAFTRLGLS
jgi:hypothetical protein